MFCPSNATTSYMIERWSNNPINLFLILFSRSMTEESKNREKELWCYDRSEFDCRYSLPRSQEIPDRKSCGTSTCPSRGRPGKARTRVGEVRQRQILANQICTLPDYPASSQPRDYTCRGIGHGWATCYQPRSWQQSFFTFLYLRSSTMEKMWKNVKKKFM